MNLLIEFVRKAVVLVLLMELVLCLQPGKKYEPYLKMLVGLMVTYTLVTNIMGIFSEVSGGMERVFGDYEWMGNWSYETQIQTEYETGGNNLERIGDINVSLEGVKVDKVEIGEIKVGNGY